MLSTKSVFIGISLLAPTPAFSMFALDGGLRILAYGDGSIEETLAFCAPYEEAVVGINLPRRLNNGAAMRAAGTHTGRGRPHRDVDMRLCEVLLRRQGVKIPATPAALEHCPQWMQQGFLLYERLEAEGFLPEPAGDVPRQVLETHAESVFRVFLNKPLLSARSLEGRLQRHLLLYEQGLRIVDPMNYFEEITRSRVLQGNLPVQMLHTSSELEALAGAYMAWRLVNRPQLVSRIGDMEEGCVLLPLWRELESSQPVSVRQMDMFGRE